VPRERFIAERDALAKDLKAAGDDGAAAAVKKLKKPSVVAWAVNAASRERPSDVEALLEAGRELRRAQRKTMTVAGTEDLRRATEARRQVVQRLTEAAIAAIGDRGGVHRDAIEGTLTAASTDDELGARLAEGTFEREARPTAGFGALEGFEVLTGGAGRGDEEERESPAARREAERQRAREAKEAERRAVAAERAAQRAAEHAAQLKEKAATAAAAAKEAESDARRLADEARTERKRADRAARSGR
jgi:hypothetical protein